MDTHLFEKLPCGGTWWNNIQYTDSSRWIQQPYENGTPDEPSFPAKRSSNVSIPEYVFRPATATARKPSNKMHILKSVLSAIDPCSSLYTRTQEQDAIETVRTRFLAFVTGQAHYFGPKKSRVLAAWLSNNRTSAEDGQVIKDFLEFLLGTQASGWTIECTSRGEWFVTSDLA